MSAFLVYFAFIGAIDSAALEIQVDYDSKVENSAVFTSILPSVSFVFYIRSVSYSHEVTIERDEMMIWCVENDAPTRNIAVYTLQSAGFPARGFDDGTSFWDALQIQHPQLVLLDRVLPGMDGLEILKRIRSSGAVKNMPVIMVAESNELEVIRCLDSGADDCLSKPFGMMEMVSRIRSVLRRYTSQNPDTALRMGDITLYPNERIVKVAGKTAPLTYKEFELLLRFLSNPETVLTREQLYKEVWRGEYTEQNRTVDMHIRTLRKKLGDSGNLIESVRYIGYRMKKVL